MTERFYITTPIYYVNALPHLGHAYTTIVADALARFQRLRGREVYFLTGTDEHGDKIAAAAAAAGETPQVYADRVSGAFQETWTTLKITHDQFIRTTSPFHKEAVQTLLQKLSDSEDIYFGEYGGHYCFGCERFYTEKELVDGKCPDHQTAPTFIKEKNYFFRMSRYQDWLLRTLTEQPDLIRPERYRNEVLSFLREPLDDLCISRPISRLTWGIPLPFDRQYVTYVWFDALVNYLSALGWPEGERFHTFWPVAEHLIGKDILKPHAVYWPTMLHAAGIPLYRHLNVHGYWNVQESKMSKSLGNVVRPLDLAAKYGRDVFRYFLLREMVFGQDAAFSEEALVGRLNADLANDLGNLVSRTLAMIERYLDGKIPAFRESTAPADAQLRAVATMRVEQVPQQMDRLAFTSALDAIWNVVREANQYIDICKPWDLAKQKNQKELERVLFHLWEALRLLGLVLSPFLPETAASLWHQLGIRESVESARLVTHGPWGALRVTGEIHKGDPLFPRVEAPTFPAREVSPGAPIR